jgi:hypothetical protein
MFYAVLSTSVGTNSERGVSAAPNSRCSTSRVRPRRRIESGEDSTLMSGFRTQPLRPGGRCMRGERLAGHALQQAEAHTQRFGAERGAVLRLGLVHRELDQPQVRVEQVVTQFAELGLTGSFCRLGGALHELVLHPGGRQGRNAHAARAHGGSAHASIRAPPTRGPRRLLDPAAPLAALGRIGRVLGLSRDCCRVCRLSSTDSRR